MLRLLRTVTDFKVSKRGWLVSGPLEGDSQNPVILSRDGGHLFNTTIACDDSSSYDALWAASIRHLVQIANVPVLMVQDVI